MQKTVEYINNRVSPATIELLIRERSKGNSLRRLGQMFNRSHERVRQLLAKKQWPESLLSESRVAAKLGYPVEWLVKLRKEGLIKPVKHFGWRYSEEQVRQIPSLIAEMRRWLESLLPESRVAAKLGYPVEWLIKLRKEGLIKPVKHFGWRYSEEQVRQIPSLIAETRRCERCGKPRPPHSSKFCRECSRYRNEHWYRILSPEKKAETIRRNVAWQKANPERTKEIRARANRKYHAKMKDRGARI